MRGIHVSETRLQGGDRFDGQLSLGLGERPSWPSRFGHQPGQSLTFKPTHSDQLRMVRSTLIARATDGTLISNVLAWSAWANSLTSISRAPAGLPLAASNDDDEQVSYSFKLRPLSCTINGMRRTAPARRISGLVAELLTFLRAGSDKVARLQTTG
jgi:hypothetical protein